MSTQRVVLLIEDDDPIREVIGNCFEDIAGWQVIAVSSGQEGLHVVESKKLDAIILDVMMPRMDGITFLRQLRAQPTMQTISVVLITANSSSVDPVDAALLGVKGVIAKPFDPMLLTEQVAQLLGWA